EIAFLRCFCQLYFTKTISDKQKATVSFPLLFVLSWGTFVSDSVFSLFQLDQSDNQATLSLSWLVKKKIVMPAPKN
ncbi:hypothetical protein, partial [Streptococcus canis]|uniref:hypothetical protein n=1 Tax=Streptococcus canis TaxID=1329 RepID=UPI002948D355